MKRLLFILLVIALIPSMVFAGSTLLNNIVAYYEFSGNSNDATGNGNNGTDTSITYSLANGKIGEGAGFNGSTSYISLGDPVDLHNAAFSVSAWFNLASTPSSYTIIAKNYSTAPWSNPYVTILVRLDSATQVEVGLSNGSTYTAHVFTVSSLSTATWYHIVFTYDGTTGILYLNGVSQGSNTYSVTLAYNTQEWTIGADHGASPHGDYFNGAIDEVGIWSRALTSGEITSLYNSGAGDQYPFSSSAVPLVQFYTFGF